MNRNDELEKTENFEESMKGLKTIIGKPVEISDIGTHKVVMSEDSDIMSDEEFEEMLENNIPLYEDLSEEELLTRQKEFANLSEEGRAMLRDITGIQNSRIITLNALMCNSVAIIKDADDDIEDIEFSEEYLKFLNWYDSLIRTGTFYPRYEEYEKIEDMCEKIGECLSLTKEESEKLRNLADSDLGAKGYLSNDMTDYIENVPLAMAALRKAKDANLTESEWNEIIKKIDNK